MKVTSALEIGFWPQKPAHWPNVKSIFVVVTEFGAKV